MGGSDSDLFLKLRLYVCKINFECIQIALLGILDEGVDTLILNWTGVYPILPDAIESLSLLVYLSL